MMTEMKICVKWKEMKFFICVMAIWGFDAVCVYQQQSINRNCMQNRLSLECRMNYWGRQINVERRCHLWPHYGNFTIYCPTIPACCCMFSSGIWSKMNEKSDCFIKILMYGTKYGLIMSTTLQLFVNTH